MGKILFVWLVVAACSSAQQPREPSNGAKKLGIASYVTRATIAHLEIDGLDAQGLVVAKLELTVGPFVMKVDDRGAVDGRQLKVTVLGKTATHESEGRNPLDLPMPSDPGIATVLGDLPVAATLESWDVQFAPRDTTATAPSQLPEEPYNICGSTGLTQTTSSPYVGCNTCAGSAGSACPESASDPMLCKQFNKPNQLGGDIVPNEIGEYRCCFTAGVLSQRVCTGRTSPPGEIQHTTCGNAGSLGCAVCWNEQLSSIQECSVIGSGGFCTAKWCR